MINTRNKQQQKYGSNEIHISTNITSTQNVNPKKESRRTSAYYELHKFTNTHILNTNADTSIKIGTHQRKESEDLAGEYDESDDGKGSENIDDLAVRAQT